MWTFLLQLRRVGAPPFIIITCCGISNGGQNVNNRALNIFLLLRSRAAKSPQMHYKCPRNYNNNVFFPPYFIIGKYFFQIAALWEAFQQHTQADAANYM